VPGLPCRRGGNNKAGLIGAATSVVSLFDMCTLIHAAGVNVPSAPWPSEAVVRESHIDQTLAATDTLQDILTSG
jgi:hypothetical protein